MQTKTKEYIRPIPATWWLRNRHVALFMLRELTAFFVLGYALFLMVLLAKANRGWDVFRDFAEGLTSPVSILLHLIVLAFVVYHSVTSFNAAPEIMVVQRGEERVPPAVVIGGNYVLWAVVTLVVLLIAVWM